MTMTRTVSIDTTRRTDVLLDKMRDKKHEWSILHGILCATHGQHDADYALIASVFDTARIAARLDDMTRAHRHPAAKKEKVTLVKKPTKPSIVQKATMYEDCRNRGASIARQVSTLLKRAGFEKSGRFRQFGGHETPGYSTRASYSSDMTPTATLYWDPVGGGGPNAHSAAKVAEMVEIINADGRFTATMGKNSAKITRKDPTT